MNIPSVTHRLRSETAEIHHHLHGLVSIDQIFSSPSAYCDLLCRYWRVIEPIESRLLKAISHVSSENLKLSSDSFTAAVRKIDWNERLQKSTWLRTDILALSEREPDCGIQCSPAIDAISDINIDSISNFVGCWYVLEGMSLGNQFLSATLRNRLGLNPETGGRFFNGYGTATKSHWEAWGKWANGIDLDSNLAVECAKQTFQCMANSLETSVHLAIDEQSSREMKSIDVVKRRNTESPPPLLVQADNQGES